MVDEAMGLLDGEIGDDVAIFVTSRTGTRRNRHRRRACASVPSAGIVFADAGPSSPDISRDRRIDPGLHIRDAIAECATRRRAWSVRSADIAWRWLTIPIPTCKRFRHAFNESSRPGQRTRPGGRPSVTDGRTRRHRYENDTPAHRGPRTVGPGFDERVSRWFDVGNATRVGEKHLSSR